MIFAATLKAHTQQVHLQLEKKMVEKIRAIQTTVDYSQLLEMMYGFYAPLQQQLQPYLHDLSFNGTQRGLQSSQILQDLRFLQPRRNKIIPLCPAVPAISCEAEALGAMYVTEGATLGGGIIAAMISRQLRIEGKEGFYFFRCYGEHTTTMWDNFKERLNAPAAPAQQDQTLRTAIDTFYRFEKWLNKALPSFHG